MNRQTSEDLRGFFRRIQALYPELFNMAHIICGNYDLAEYALRSAILSVWQQNSGNAIGLQEKLRGSLKRIALLEALSSKNETVEYTWDGLPEPIETDSVLFKLLAQEANETQRIILMRYGCNFVPSRISRITGFTVGQVRDILTRFENRSIHRLPAKDHRSFDQLIRQTMAEALNHPGIVLPDPAVVYRAFESEALETTVSSHRLSKAVGQALLLILALLCAGIFWLIAVISTPATLESTITNSGIIQTTDSENPNIFSESF